MAKTITGHNTTESMARYGGAALHEFLVVPKGRTVQAVILSISTRVHTHRALSLMFIQ